MTRFDPTAAQQLAYEAKRKSLRRRRMLTLLGAIVLLCALTPVVVRYARMGIERARVTSLYRQCAAYTAPATAAVWEEDPQRIRQLRDYETVASHHGDAAYFVPPAWRQLNSAIGQQIQTWGTLFLHERTTPSAGGAANATGGGGGGGGSGSGGKRLLVGVDIAGWSRGGPVVLFARVRTISPALPMRLPVEEKVEHPSVHLSPTEGPLRLFAGQPDPADASHFTIDYELGDQHGIIDGWLKADGSVLLEKRSG